MAQRSVVPQFGNWENANNVPYTAYFEKASNRNVKMSPNNPQRNLDVSSKNVSPVQAPSFKKETNSGAQERQQTARKKRVHRTSLKDGDLKRPSESLLHHNTANRRVSNGLPLHHDGSIRFNDSIPRRNMQKVVGSDNRFEQSPLQPNQQAKIGGKGNGTYSLSWQRKVSTEGSNNLAPSTSGRCQLRSVTRGNGTPDHSASVPKFGDWDETNPASADGFTHKFDIVRAEKLNGNGMIPVAATQSSSSTAQKQLEDQTSKVCSNILSCCCFPWSK